MSDGYELPPSQIEVPLSPGETPLQEGADGYPVGYGPGTGSVAMPQFDPNAARPPQTNQYQDPVPPQAAAPEGGGVYFNQGNQLEGQPNAPMGAIFDSLNNELPQGFVDEMDRDPTQILPGHTLYPEGLRQDWIDQWKVRFGRTNVYLVTIAEHVFVYRGISRVEWAWIKQQGFDQETFENQMVWTCMLWPRINSEVAQAWLGGIASSLTEYIMRFSGFGAQAVPVRL